MFIGTVSRVSSSKGVWVTAPSMFPGVELGPLPVLAQRSKVSGSLYMSDQYKVGDRVLVDELELDEFIVLGIVRRGVSANGAG